MEELLSTDKLDREILEDARKKAQRIIKSAEEVITLENADWEKKILEKTAGFDKEYIKQKKIETDKIMLRLPVDKQRLKTELMESLLNSAVNYWYKKLNRKEILNLLFYELSRILSFYYSTPANKNKHVHSCRISKIEINETQDILKKLNIECGIKEDKSLCEYPSITLETDDFIITASIKKIIDFIFDEKRFELAESLVGHDFLKEEIK